jgi:exopolysaccharide production protein ExoQ
MLDPLPPPKVISPGLDLFEKRFAVFALLVFSGVLNLSSYYHVLDPISSPYGAIGEPPIDLTNSVLDSAVSLMRMVIYAVTFFFMLARFKTVVRPAMRDPFLWALVGIAATSFLWSDVPNVSQKSGVLLLQTTLFGLYFASRFSMKEQLRIVAWALGIASVFSLLYSLVLPGSAISSEGLWRGPLAHKNLFARFMVVSGLSLLLVALNSRKSRMVIWTVFGITVALILLSKSKTALLIFIALVILVPIYRMLQGSASLAIPLFSIMILVGTSVATWFVTNWEPFLYSIGKDPTFSGRTDIWGAVIDKIWERPWLGYGYNAFWDNGGVGQKAVFNVIFLNISQAHNGYLNLGAELGLLGLLFFGLSLLTAYIRAINWARLGRTSEEVWPIIYITFLILYNQSESTNVEFHSLFWILYVTITLSMKPVQMLETSENYKDREKEEELVEYG